MIAKKERKKERKRKEKEKTERKRKEKRNYLIVFYLMDGGESHQIYTITISMPKKLKCMLGWILFIFYIDFILGLIKNQRASYI